MDRREVQRLVDARERGRRQAAITSRAVAVGGVALAAVFGIVLAQHPQNAHAASPVTQPQHAPTTHSATPTPPPSSNPTTVSPTTVAPTTAAPLTTQPAPVLQPPPAPPVVATGGGPATGSGGS